MNGVKIRSVSFKSFKCFEDMEIDCRKDKSTLYQWTVLLGNNNTGKTSLLRAIADLRPKRLRFVSKGSKVINEMVPSFVSKEGMNEISDEFIVSSQLTSLSPVSWMYGNKQLSYDDKGGLDTFFIFGYGVSRYASNSSLSNQVCDDCDTLFSQEKRLINLEEWLMQIDYAAKNNNELAAKRLAKIRETICGNILAIIDYLFVAHENR